MIARSSCPGKVSSQFPLFLKWPYEDQKLMISRLPFCGVTIDVTGKTAAGDEVEGKVTVPEVSHEMIDGHSKYEVSLRLAH